ncbi:MAG: 50S ribosomal protein L20 [Alphaproteobacteria bacterium]|nr:50S ribosomal protein L20 [Alphaproteobacteria bacterium]
MVRIKRAVHGLKRRKNLLKKAKGYRWNRSSKERQAKDAVLHAGNRAFHHRRKKKGEFRALWQVRITAETRALGYSYSKFMGALKKKKSPLNRKVLSELAAKHPDLFKKIIEYARS